MIQQLRKPPRRTGLAAAVTFGAWCVSGALGGPLAAQNREHQQMAAELRMLQEQQQQLALTLAQVIEALKIIPTRIDDASSAMRKGFADQELKVGALGGDVSLIRERTQDSDTRLRSLGPASVPSNDSGNSRSPAPSSTSPRPITTPPRWATI